MIDSSDISALTGKKWFYISAFIFLGILVQFLVHAVIEIIYTALLIKKYEIFGFGLSFDIWFDIHAIFSVALFTVGIIIGFRQGVYWWKRIYGHSIQI
ncbi:hypothetical protein IIB50_01170 [Patescibacteria group bacterium]|nr:hypothetical protein [Patescibacteria group bacterium]